jgi:SAM-dependent methyltransferase
VRPVVGDVTIAPMRPLVEDVLTGATAPPGWRRLRQDRRRLRRRRGRVRGARRREHRRPRPRRRDRHRQSRTPGRATRGIVTGIDIAPNLIAIARAKASAGKLDIAFDEGNAESLPYESGAFRTVMSMFGVMFVPRPERALAEMLRVTRPGGRIALASWTPDASSQGPQSARRFCPTGARRAEPAGVGRRDADEGAAGVVRRRDSLRQVHKALDRVRVPITPGGVVELFREYYGPSVNAFARLDAAARGALEATLIDLWSSRNVGHAGSTYVEAEFLEVRITVG